MKHSVRIYFTVFLLSLSALIYEITLSRIFSYILTYHFVFIIIALAILAVSLGQLFAARLFNANRFSYTKFLILIQLLFPASLAIAFILPSSDAYGTGSTGLFMYSLLAGITFFFIGIIFAGIFQEHGSRSSILYTVDLLGAAVGSILSLVLLNDLSVIPTLAVVLVAISVSSFLLLNYESKFQTTQIVITTAALLFSLYFIFYTPYVNIAIAKSPDKDLLRLKNNPSVKTTTVESKWNSFGRTDLVKSIYPDPDNAGTGSTASMSMFIDGAAGTQVVNISELEKDRKKLFHTLMHANLFFPFNFLKDDEKDSVLIIGPGGGIDIAAAYFGGVKQIDAVEVNPTFVELMKKYNKSTFAEKPNINVIVREGRNFVRNTKNKYDLIFLTIPITKGGRSNDFVNLTENYLFTEEALKDYLHILTNEGRIVFTTHDREETYKILSNYMDLQNKTGISNAEASKNFYVIDQGMMPLLVIKKVPFTKNEIEPRHFFSHQDGFDKGVSFFPFTKQIEKDTVVRGVDYGWSMFDNVLYDVSQNRYSFHDLAKKASINLHPVTDDSPFFFNYELGLPENLTPLIWLGVILFIWSIYMFKKNWGMSVNTHKETDRSRKNLKILAIISFLLGFTYIFSESYLFQALNLQLNNHLKSFSLLLFSFLLGNGAGSYFTNLVKHNRQRVIGLAAIGIILEIAVEAFLVLPNLVTSIPEVYLFLLVFIPAIIIGIPFPLLLAEMNEHKIRNGIAVLLSISGIAGFIGSILVFITAVLFGYSYLILINIVLYLPVTFFTLFRKSNVLLNV